MVLLAQFSLYVHKGGLKPDSLSANTGQSRSSKHETFTKYRFNVGSTSPTLIAPVAETGFSHRLPAQKIVGHFFGLSYRKSGSNQVKNIFLESVTFKFHTRMLSSEVALSLKSYGHFSDPGVGIALSHRHVGFFGWSKYIHPRPRRGRHGNPTLVPTVKQHGFSVSCLLEHSSYSSIGREIEVGVYLRVI